MNKFSFRVLTLMIVLWSHAFAQVSQDRNRQIIQELCGQNYQQNKQGTGVVVGDWQKQGLQYCIKVECSEKQDDNNQSTVIRTKCISEDEYKKLILGVINNTVGVDVNGDGKVDSADDINGDGKVDNDDLNEWRRRNGPGGNRPTTNGSVSSGVDIDVERDYPQCKRECGKRFFFFGKKGEERKKCVRCLHKAGVSFTTDELRAAGVILVNASGVPSNSSGSASVPVGGGNGSVTGTVSGTGNQSGPGTVTGPNGGLSISGNASTGIVLPSFCNSKKRRDLKRCREWMDIHRPFMSASSSNPSIAMAGGDAEILSRYDLNNCVNCQAGSRRDRFDWGGVLGPLAIFGSAMVGANANRRAQEAWAGAAIAGYEQCQLSQNNYLQYLSANELPGLSPAQQAAMNCNGFSLNGYAGLQNPMLNNWYGAGYSPGFIGGMMGPYGGMNPYGLPGGFVGGAVGGVVGGYPGGYVAGGMPGGYVAGGMPGGYVAGGYPGGYGPGGMAGGFVNGISLAGGFNGGAWNGGFNGGGWNGGFNGGGWNGGFNGGAWNGGFNGGGFNGGGFNSGGGFDYYSSQQASGYDRMMQQQGIMYQMGMNSTGYNGGFGGGFGGGYNANQFPLNAGFNLQFGLY